MFTFDTDDCLAGPVPAGLDSAVWGIARGIAASHLCDTLCTFYVPASADDLIDGGPISEPVCCGGNLAAAIAGGAYRLERHACLDGLIVCAMPVTVSGYRADVLLIPVAEWLPSDIRDALSQLQLENDHSSPYP